MKEHIEALRKLLETAMISWNNANESDEYAYGYASASVNQMRYVFQAIGIIVTPIRENDSIASKYKGYTLTHITEANEELHIL